MLSRKSATRSRDDKYFTCTRAITKQKHQKQRKHIKIFVEKNYYNLLFEFY